MALFTLTQALQPLNETRPLSTTTAKVPDVHVFVLSVVDSGTCVDGVNIVIEARRLTVIWPLVPQSAVIYEPRNQIPATLDAINERLQECNPYLNSAAWNFGGTLMALFVHLDKLLALPKGAGICLLRNSKDGRVDVQSVREGLLAAAAAEAEAAAAAAAAAAIGPALPTNGVVTLDLTVSEEEDDEDDEDDEAGAHTM